jgi:hypothetical protein
VYQGETGCTCDGRTDETIGTIETYVIVVILVSGGAVRFSSGVDYSFETIGTIETEVSAGVRVWIAGG